VTLNGKPAAWKYDASKRVLRVDWKADTSDASAIIVTREAERL
jgi:hypothetical protein